MSNDDFPLYAFTDYPGNPILAPTDGFQSKGLYNPTVIEAGKIFHMLYRAEADDGLTGRIGLAKSGDGFCFTCHPQPVFVPKEDFDKGGCEDPRVVRFGETYYLTYVGNSQKYHVSNICMATSDDLLHWKKHGSVLSPRDGSWSSGQLKAGVIMPQKINGKYVMYFMGEERPWTAAIGIAYSDDLFNWYEPSEKPVLTPRRGYFDSKGVEPGPSPVILDEGILLIYNGWADDCIYKPAGVLFSREEPTKVLKRTSQPLLVLSKNYGGEFGASNHCVAEGLVKHGDQWLLYYGAADRLTCLAMSDGRK